MLIKILKGNASYLLDISYYIHNMYCNGDIIKNKYGLEDRHCNKETLDVQNLQNLVISTFGIWTTDVEMSEWLLDTNHHC